MYVHVWELIYIQLRATEHYNFCFVFMKTSNIIIIKVLSENISEIKFMNLSKYNVFSTLYKVYEQVNKNYLVIIFEEILAINFESHKISSYRLIYLIILWKIFYIFLFSKFLNFVQIKFVKFGKFYCFVKYDLWCSLITSDIFFFFGKMKIFFIFYKFRIS